ncbi:MAG: penicillin-binding protein 1A [Alphaproteobacteria bacterium]|nr:penicillin-binding protein 1A [Alphaproteobacteria bacterium]
MLRILSWFFGFSVFVGLIAIGGVAWYISVLSADLPDYTVLKDYQPPVTTRVHAADGTLLAEYARERRLFQPIETIPPIVVEAFLSAEDKDFYSHGGISLDGTIRALRDNFLARVEGDSAIQGGGSTITQQVAKNFLLSSEQTWERKAKEALIAIRIETTFSKDRILELYLNEIFMGSFGGQTYGVAAAALNYFDKALYELKLSEVAYLAALPKGANNYHPFKHPRAAIERRNWVLDRMVENGYITAKDGEDAKKDSLDVVPRETGTRVYAAEYFTEEVRRELAKLYGEDQLYGGGLSVRTTLDPKMQEQARRALMDGLIDYDRTKGFHGPVATIDVSGGDWGAAINAVKPLSDVPEWTLAVVLELDTNEARIGLRPGTDVDDRMLPDRVTASLPGRTISWISKKLGEVLHVGDVVYVSAVADEEGVYTLEQVPEVEGAIVAMDPRTGRVLAMVGGFSFDASEFNRATQALRQPGSSIKPIVYSAALDNGYTPASVVLDAPLEIVNPDGSVWRPENYAQEFYGPQTLRRGIENSRNVMTVRLAKDIGMPLVVEYFKLFGIYGDLLPVLSMALGAGETTDLQMTSAYATIANGGRRITPTLIDRVQDRYGTTIFKHDERVCDGCVVEEWNNQPEPLIIDNREQVLDPMTAYQITSMMEGVIRRGTGTEARRLNRPVAGKTGTSSDYKDAWFVGFTPELAVGVYVGYDNPRSMGRQATGSTFAAPIFTNFMEKALEGKPPTPFNMPSGMSQEWIDPATGVAAISGEAAILEAFKPGTGPNLVTSVIGVDSSAFLNLEDGFADPNAGRGGLF